MCHSTRLAVTGMVLCACAAWLLQHPYAGLVHDSTLYTLLALARLHPDLLSNDIFLRFGSQDQYTVFSPIYSCAIALLGLEPAAALLTFASQLAFFGCAWLVARHFMSSLAATFAVALLIVAPGEYGSAVYFHYAEGFLTPRLPAEALVLGALAATLTRRYWIAVACLLAATILHPSMATAGLAMLILTFVAPSRPRFVLATGAILLPISLALLHAIAPFGRLDSTWLHNVGATSPYLYVSRWSLSDWSRVVTALALLPLGLLTGTTPLLRRVCAGGLITAACGLLVSALYCDLLHVTIFTELQAWRWLWLADVIAVILAPAIGADCWRSGAAGRTAIVLLGSAWLFRGDSAALWIIPLAFACVAAPANWREHRYMKLVFLGSCGLLLIAAAATLSGKFSYLPIANTGAPPAMQKLRLVCASGVIPGAVLLVAWLGLRHWQSPVNHIAVITAAALACAAFLPVSWASWTHAYFTPALADKFAQWRTAIPPRAEVMWPDTPIGAWSVLERPSYWSTYQVAGAIFSRQKALLLRQRTASIYAAAKASGPGRDTPEPAKEDFPAPSDASKINADGLARACTDPDLSYVVSWLRLGKTSVAPVAPDPAKPLSRLYLYRCADFRV